MAKKQKTAKRGAAKKVAKIITKKNEKTGLNPKPTPRVKTKETPSSEKLPQAEEKKKLTDAMKERLVAGKDLVVAGLTTAKDFIVNCFNGFIDFVKSFFSKILGFFKGLVSKEQWNDKSGKAKFYLNIAFLFAAVCLAAQYVVALYGLAITTAILGGGTVLAYGIHRVTTDADMKEMVGNVSIKDAFTPTAA